MCAEHKGKTIHLLKARSKPITQERKRRKIEIKGTFEQYLAAQPQENYPQIEESKNDQREEAVKPGAQSKAIALETGRRKVPNIIGNVEDEALSIKPSTDM